MCVAGSREERRYHLLMKFLRHIKRGSSVPERSISEVVHDAAIEVPLDWCQLPRIGEKKSRQKRDRLTGGLGVHIGVRTDDNPVIQSQV
jgi:hypothetical protein